MPTDVEFNSELRIIEVFHTGIVTEEDLRQSDSAATGYRMEHDVDAFLVDTSGVESVANALDLYDLPELYDEGQVSRSIRIALLLPHAPAARQMAQFYDNVCNNRGWQVRSFDHRSAAIEWLASG